ncbi:hypothetical protein [Microbacterium hominis]|uniref:hypothetical protein n=1 Tax=Microbacterium hominis TaxID=162426 RepID=UPI0020B78C48|nr:hypothetical protein [Microbacterium hominis]
MLVIDRLRRLQRDVREGARDDSGAVLVSVVVVMIVGFIVASIIAASVMFTIRANAQNSDNLDAFVAAESGRDFAVGQVANACAIAAPLTGTAPDFTATVYTTTGAEPTSPSSPGLTANACPTDTTTFVLIHSVGTGPDGSTSTIDSVYPWQVTYSEQPGGTLAYFDGTFKATGSTYEGDLVIRENNAVFDCSNASDIRGDLWVVRGSVKLSTGCKITGSIFARGTVTSNSQGVRIGGDIIAGGDVSLPANDNQIAGSIHSGAKITLDGTGSTQSLVGGDVVAKSTATVDSKWTVTGATTSNGPDPVYDPTLEWVRDVTTWLDLSNQNWGTVENLATCDMATIRSKLNTAGIPLYIDMSACGTGNNPKKLNIDIDAATTLKRDAIFMVPAAMQMIVDITANITIGAGTPELLFVHADSSTAVNATTGEPEPHCQSGTHDTFKTGAVTIAPRTMVYTPCGLNGTVSANFSGQFYTANDGNRVVNGTFTCAHMSWTPAFEELSCRIRGAGGVAENRTVVQRLSELVFQTER